MELKKSLDPAFWKNSKNFFLSFQDQVDLIEALFIALANEFPQAELLKHHPESKGCKLSKGSNLEKLPYQVLDIVRDFDPENGFNIRLLNWWGNGCFIFITYGTRLKSLLRDRDLSIFKDYFISDEPSPYAYGNLLKNKLILNEKNITLAINSTNQLQIWKEVHISEDFSKTLSHLSHLTSGILNFPLFKAGNSSS